MLLTVVLPQSSADLRNWAWDEYASSRALTDAAYKREQKILKLFLSAQQAVEHATGVGDSDQVEWQSRKTSALREILRPRPVSWTEEYRQG